MYLKNFPDTIRYIQLIKYANAYPSNIPCNSIFNKNTKIVTNTIAKIITIILDIA